MKISGKYKSYGEYGAVGIQFVLTVLLCLWLGIKADEWLDTKPWLTLIGIFFGLFAAFVNLVKSVNRNGSKSKS